MKRLLLLPALLALLAVPARGQITLFDANALLYSTTNPPPSSASSFLKTNSYNRGVNLRRTSGGLPSVVGATPNQGSGAIVYGGVATPNNRVSLNPAVSYVANATALNLPRQTNSSGNITVVLRAVQVGAPYISRQVSFLFGQVITPPETDQAGLPLSPAQIAAGYWRPEPYTINNHSNAPYYWSPNAGAVFAAQPGPIQVTWQTATPTTSQPAAPKVVDVDYINVGGLYYLLKTSYYVVSGSAIQPTRKMYWTEREFQATGKPVVVPKGLVGDLKIAYNTLFPERVTNGYPAPTQITATTNLLQELRTLWYDSQQGFIYAFNQEGRVFLELLGDVTGPASRRHLGFEIVDVSKYPVPVDRTAELGEKISAGAIGGDGKQVDDNTLYPEPLQAGITLPFLYRQSTEGVERADFYAVRETINPNDSLVHWLEVGLQGLRWPLLLARYTQVWPSDIGKYSQYVRPLVATEAAAALTAVALPNDNAPAIQYQDPMDGPRAKLTDTFALYTFLDAAHPAHRTLLRFNSGDRVAFERVFSWLDQNLIGNNFANSVATHLVTVANYVMRGVNGKWDLSVTDKGADDSGLIASWAIVVVTTNVGGGTLTTNEFSSTGNISIPPLGKATPFPSTVTVSGITAPVIKIAVKLNGFSHSYPQDLIAELVGPNSGTVTLMSSVGGGRPGVTGLNLGFDDDASLQISSSTPVPGTYRPQGGSLASLLLPAGQPAFPNAAVSPRVVRSTAVVAERISAPTGEAGATGAYLAGFILQTNGNSFNTNAYKDPFVVGFEAANQGAIIPVNAIPGTNNLEVWWFRRNATNAVKNEINGFKPIYWPTVIGLYTLEWPNNASEIVMASNDGSGALPSEQAVGTIYTQNDPNLAGYNPNEEHAVMIGGQAYALRDDLNLTSATTPAVLTGAGATYSSQPFVLLDYTDSDGRPKMRAFKVLREKPAAGIVFDYIVTAGGNAAQSGRGQMLQPPMPLPFLSPPVELVTNGVGAAAVITTINYNTEPSANSGDLPGNWASADQAKYASYKSFTYRDRKEKFWVTRGAHAGPPVLQSGTYDTTLQTFSAALPAAVAVVNQPFTNLFHTSRRTDSLVINLQPGSPTLPDGLTLGVTSAGLALQGVPTAAVGPNTYSFVISDNGDNTAVTNTLPLSVFSSGTVVAQGPLVITSVNQYAANATATHTGRPPFLAAAPTPANSFTMRFYYKTQDGFAWPGFVSAPAVGNIVPYLTPLGATVDKGAKTTPALDIVYRPVWPGNPPQMQFGETLMAQKAGLPQIRGQTSVQLLYQQGIARDLTAPKPAVVLHDPTREKTYALQTDAAKGLAKLPDGVRTDIYQGKTYFPNLPPHLAKRFFFDPIFGPKGTLKFIGQYMDDPVGEKYVLLNVLRGSDLAYVKGLCPDTDAKKGEWDSAIDKLATEVVTFGPDPKVPGNFIPAATNVVGITDLAAVTNSASAVDSYALSASGPGQGYVTFIVGNSGNPSQTPAGDPVTVYVLKVTGTLFTGEIKIIPNENPLSEFSSFQHTADLAGQFADYEYQWKINPPVDGVPPVPDAAMSRYQPLTNGVDITRYTLGGSGIQSLVDNYLVLRYRPINTSHPLYRPGPAATATNWSAWTEPQLAEGWIKRVLAGINPFNQRVTDLANNTVNTDANILTSAGKRWEGDVALNLASISGSGTGLIEIYETVLGRGRGLSIDAGINFGPANDALLLAAGYISDLYMMVGNEAYADAANPTIGIGTKDQTYGDIATSLFAFKGQLPSLLEEELALLRGRDDFLQPGVLTPPAYNRLWWNYTRGIDAGEVIYALNYNILDQNTDGKVDAADAAILYPQGHGDAYGHYLMALKGYYSLFLSSKFDWVPRIEAVTILGKPVAVDYLDERKFATAAAAVARTGRQIFDLTWRKDYQPGQDAGWESFATARTNTQRTVYDGNTPVNVVREWGVDQWAARTGQGALINWVVGNAILPAVDPDPNHEGIQKIDRTTVPELAELGTTLGDLQTAMDNAEGRLTPLGLAQGSLAFDINANSVVGSEPQTHFEQVYARAKSVLNNAVVAFDDAKDVTRLMRSEQDSLEDFQTSVDIQELAFKNTLIELYGTPYTDDIGPGKTWKQGYDGPDLVHYAYVDYVELPFPSLWSYANAGDTEFRIDIQNHPLDWFNNTELTNLNVVADLFPNPVDANSGYSLSYTKDLYIPYRLVENTITKPPEWTGRRASPGQIQQAQSKLIAARASLRQALYDNNGNKESFDRNYLLFLAKIDTYNKIRGFKQDLLIGDGILRAAKLANTIYQAVLDNTKSVAQRVNEAILEGLPRSLIVGMANGGDATAPARSLLRTTKGITEASLDGWALARASVVAALEASVETAHQLVEFRDIAPLEHMQDVRGDIAALGDELGKIQNSLYAINARLRDLDDAERDYRATVAKGDRIQAEQLVFRKRAAAVIQGYRTRDAAFRIFRNEKLERYKSLFDLASRYSYLAANAYDYETGLLGTTAGKSFINRIVNSRALGVVKNGEPQYAGSNTGDPGLSSALAEMKADWDVLKGRLGFNNPDAYGTTVSLRTGQLRILPTADGDTTWQDVLHAGFTPNLLDDSDVRRNCLQLTSTKGLPVPGIVLTFSTTIAEGRNLFGQPIAAGDQHFDISAFATKIFAAGVALEGYRGMTDPVANGTAVNGAGGTSPTDPSLAYLDPLGLDGTPYVYLIPVGVDSMRSPPLGDTSDIRSWNVSDVAIPLPFNIGASDLSTKALYQSADSLTEPLFGIRQHQAFRPVSSATAFSSHIYGDHGALEQSQFTNNRLIGRSVWNSQWKLVIPGNRLLADPKEGISRFIQTVKDVKLHFVTYSYSGN